MIKEFSEIAKKKALHDDNVYWFKQEQFIQRKEIKYNDLPYKLKVKNFIFFLILFYIIFKVI